MKKKFKLLILSLGILVIGVTVAMAQNAKEISPVGLWQTIDDKSGEARSHVRIWKNSKGVLYGKIVKLLNRDDADTVTCTKCTDDRAGQKVQGLEILRGLKQKDPSDPYFWDQGTVLDPENGKSYKGYVKVSEDNKVLTLRGYIGIPAFGRSQKWKRLE